MYLISPDSIYDTTALSDFGISGFVMLTHAYNMATGDTHLKYKVATVIKERLTNFLNYLIIVSNVPLNDAAIGVVESHKGRLSKEILLSDDKKAY